MNDNPRFFDQKTESPSHLKCIKEDDPVVYTDGYCLYVHCDWCGCLYSRARNSIEWKQIDNSSRCYNE